MLTDKMGGYDVADLQKMGMRMVFGKNGPYLEKIDDKHTPTGEHVKRRPATTNLHGLIGLISVILVLYGLFRLIN